MDKELQEKEIREAIDRTIEERTRNKMPIGQAVNITLIEKQVRKELIEEIQENKRLNLEKKCYICKKKYKECNCDELAGTYVE